MGSHPANLALRFILELTALFALGWWGWSVTDGWLRFVLVALFPLAATAIWGTFAVPDDPSRSGEAPVVVPGRVRLLIEFVVFGAGVVGFVAVGQTALAIGFLIVVIVHYALSIDRMRWLLER